MSKFNTQHLLPYFKAVYQDLLIRSAPSKDQKPTLVDRATIAEFANLPGILSDRFWALLSNQAKDPRVTQSNFCQVMQRLYSSQLEEKISLAFRTYDFDNDGQISAEDVRLVLNYIPLKTARKEEAEGLYQRNEGKDMNDAEREQNQQAVARFVGMVFEHKPSMSLKEFVEFNTAVSSEMFLMIIATL